MVKHDQLFKLGAPSDTERVHEQRCPEAGRVKVAEAQGLINRGYAVNNKSTIEKTLLQPMSLVPLTARSFFTSFVQSELNLICVDGV